MTESFTMALDLGSGSTRAVVVDATGQIRAEARQSVRWTYPEVGWANVDPDLLVDSVKYTMARAIEESGLPRASITVVGITSHRESIIVWDRASGRPIHDGIIWISSQTDDIVLRWSEQGLDERFEATTGLRNDSFFSAAKIVWILENVPSARERAKRGELAAGTVDCWILWNLTGGAVHATDPSCASRTALFDISRLNWDEDLCDRLDIPVSLLPQIFDSNAEFGHVVGELLTHRPPIRAVIADQQAGMLGQACLSPGASKHTFGTAGVLTANTGETPAYLRGMTSSVAWSVSGHSTYEVEGVVFSSGQTLQWMKDALGMLSESHDIEALITSVESSEGVVVVPAFGGLCAPHWRRDVRAAISGIGLATEQAHLARAAVEASVFQVVDILHEFQQSGLAEQSLKVDGGGAKSDFVCQLLSDLGRVEVIRPRQLERTALGCAFMAGVGNGIWSSLEEATSSWQVDRIFEPAMSTNRRSALLDQWHTALNRTLQSEVVSPLVPGDRRDIGGTA